MGAKSLDAEVGGSGAGWSLGEKQLVSACAHDVANFLANFQRRTQLQLTDAVGLHGARVAEKACGTPRSAITMQLR